MISNKKRWLIIIFSSVIICSVFSIIYFILTNNKKEIIYEQEYEVKDNVFIKESEDAMLELHLDTDDANACFAENGQEVEIIN